MSTFGSSDSTSIDGQNKVLLVLVSFNALGMADVSTQWKSIVSLQIKSCVDTSLEDVSNSLELHIEILIALVAEVDAQIFLLSLQKSIGIDINLQRGVSQHEGF